MATLQQIADAFDVIAHKVQTEDAKKAAKGIATKLREAISQEPKD